VVIYRYGLVGSLPWCAFVICSGLFHGRRFTAVLGGADVLASIDGAPILQGSTIA